jgi:hypothetical protein
LKGFGIVEVMCVYDVDISLKDSRTTNVVQVNLFFKVTFIEGLETNFGLLLAAQKNLVLKVTLEENAHVDG